MRRSTLVFAVFVLAVSGASPVAAQVVYGPEVKYETEKKPPAPKLETGATLAVDAAAAELACAQATTRADVIARRLQRLRKWARLSGGETKQHLKRRAQKAARKWRAARDNAEAICG
ncbi:MAG TPA: hypothetical protein VFJ57_03100 [Solirubrobacterales bacterium]|nr:hypothetical protein [Solirubrobacterales bacterium]